MSRFVFHVSCITSRSFESSSYAALRTLDVARSDDIQPKLNKIMNIVNNVKLCFKDRLCNGILSVGSGVARIESAMSSTAILYLSVTLISPIKTAQPVIKFSCPSSTIIRLLSYQT